MRALYFAYGSNMNQSRLQARVGRVKQVGTYTLKGYKLVFNCGSGPNVFANIEPSKDPQDYVEGVVYEMRRRQIRLLDTYEGFPFAYNRHEIIYQGRSMWIYIATPDYIKMRHPKATPQMEYLANLLKGCMDHDFRYTYRRLQQLRDEKLLTF